MLMITYPATSFKGVSWRQHQHYLKDNYFLLIWVLKSGEGGKSSKDFVPLELAMYFIKILYRFWAYKNELSFLTEKKGLYRSSA